MDTFDQAATYAKQMEKNALEHLPFSGKVEVVRAIDFYPDSMEGLVFEDLINRYEKIQKVIKASQMAIFEKPAVGIARAAVAQREEVETRVKELTSHAVEDLDKELKSPAALPLPPSPETALEFEKPSEEIEFPPLPSPPAVPEKKPDARAPESPVFPVAEKPAAPSVPVPPPLEASAAAEQKYSEIEAHFERQWEGKISEETIKKKMLELTKELFKERSMTQRERIKNEIAVLKNMLTQVGKKGAAKEAVALRDFVSPMAETLATTQLQEVVALKDALANYYKRRMEEARKRFYEQLQILPEEDSAGRKKRYEQLVFELTQLMETGARQLDEREKFVAQKHQSELEKLRESVKDKRTQDQIGEKSARIESSYARDFAALEEMLKKNIENTMEKCGREILRGAPSEKEEKATPMVFEINETDEGTLLYYLHSKKPEVYKKYERKHLSRQEAVFYAKVLMAQDKGMGDEAIRKYFGSWRGEDIG